MELRFRKGHVTQVEPFRASPATSATILGTQCSSRWGECPCSQGSSLFHRGALPEQSQHQRQWEGTHGQLSVACPPWHDTVPGTQRLQICTGFRHSQAVLSHTSLRRPPVTRHWVKSCWNSGGIFQGRQGAAGREAGQGRQLTWVGTWPKEKHLPFQKRGSPSVPSLMP